MCIKAVMTLIRREAPRFRPPHCSTHTPQAIAKEHPPYLQNLHVMNTFFNRTLRLLRFLHTNDTSENDVTRNKQITGDACS